MNGNISESLRARNRAPVALLVAALAAVASLGLAGPASAAPATSATAEAAAQIPAEATGLGQLSGLLPRNKLTLQSAIEVNLSQEYVRLPLYPGIAYAGTSHAETVWYILEDASTSGAADDLGVNFAPKLAAPAGPAPGL